MSTSTRTVNTGYGNANQDLTGALPASLGDLGPAMGWLNLEGNQISGEVPTSLGAFTALTRLFLQRNGGITGVPTDIGEMSGGTILYI